MYSLVFLACPCHKIYMVEAVGLKIPIILSLKLRLLWTYEICGNFLKSWYFVNNCLKVHHLIFLPNKIRLNLRNTFVMSRNKHISKKTSCFSRKRSKNKVRPNEFERRILKLSCYACSDNPKCPFAYICDTYNCNYLRTPYFVPLHRFSIKYRFPFPILRFYRKIT